MAETPFEIPEHVRAATEQNVQHARQIYGHFMNAMEEAMGLWLRPLPPGALTTGFKAFQERAVEYAKVNGEAAFALASEIAKARDMQEVVQLQSSFAQKQMQTYADQVKELGKLMTTSAKSN